MPKTATSQTVQPEAPAPKELPLMTADEFLTNYPTESRYKWELVRGRMIISEPWPNANHGGSQARIARLLVDYVEANKLGEIYTDVAFRTRTDPDQARVPDLAFVRIGQNPAPDAPPAVFPFSPEFAVEVLSPSNRPRQIAEKVREYLDAGSRLIWVADPATYTVAVHRPGAERVVLTRQEIVTGEDVLPGLRCGVWELFRR